MPEPTQLDRIEAAQAAQAKRFDRLELTQKQHTGFLIAITNGVQIMSQQVDDETAAEGVLSGKVDQVLAALAAGRGENDGLKTQITALQAQIAQLLADGLISTADAAKLSAATSDMQAKSAAIDVALTPPTPTP